MAEKTSLDVVDAPEVEDVLADHTGDRIPAEVELDEAGNPVEPEPDPDDETDEVEKDGQKFRIPRALKDNFLMQRDYADKVQALAEKERQVDAAFQQHGAISAAEIQAQARVIALDGQIAAYGKVDWQAWNQANPAAASAAFMAYSGLKDQRQDAFDHYGQARQQRALIEQQETARRIGEGQAAIAEAIPGWNAGRSQTLRGFAQKHYGFTAQELNEIDDPRVVRALNDAFERVQAETRSKTVEKVQAQAAMRPAGKVTGSAAPIRPLDDRASTDAWMKARQKQLSSR